MKRRRLLLGLLLGVVTPLVLGVVVVLLALSSKAFAKKVIAFGLGKSKGIEIAEIRGPLKGPLYLFGVSYRSGALTAMVDTLLLEWRPTKLLLGRIELEKVYASGVHITLPDSAPPDTLGTAKARLQRPNTPLPVVLGDVSIRGIELNAPGDVTLRSGELLLDGTLAHYRFALKGTGFSPTVGTVVARLVGTGGLEDVVLDSSTATVLHGSASATGKVGWWPKVTWDLVVTGDSVNPALLPVAARWPGRVAFHLTTTGVIDSGGFAGRASIDSVGGTLRGQRLAGHAEVGFAPQAWDFRQVDLTWGSAHLLADAAIRDTLTAQYDLRIGDLRSVTRNTRGSLALNGTARGPALLPRVQARVEARNLVSGTNRIGHLAGTALVDLAPSGRNDIELKGEHAAIGRMAYDSVRLSVRGTHRSHVVTARARGPADSLNVRLAGGVAPGTRWRGTLSALALQSASWGGWRLERPAALALSPTSGRVDTLCLAADSAGGRLCGAGDWRSARTWNVLATLENVPASRLPLTGPGASLNVRGTLEGSLGATLDAHALAGRLSGSFRAHTDSVAYRWHKNGEKTEHRYVLDSAVMALQADPGAAITGTLGIRLSDEHRGELAVLAGTLNLPDYVLGSQLTRRPLSWKLDGQAKDLAFLEPFVFGIDSLRGAVLLAAEGGGTLATPTVKGRLGVQSFALGFPGRRAVTGAWDVTVDGGLGNDRLLAGEARLIARNLGWNYLYYAQQRRLSVDSGTVVLRADSAGAHGTLGFAVHDAKGTGVASLDGTLELPEYRRVGEPLAAQPVQLTLSAKVPDLAVLQPLALSADSLAGKLSLELGAKGHIGTPILIGALHVDSARGRLPTGAMAHGSLDGELDVHVGRDKSLIGSLRLVPRDTRMYYTVGAGTAAVRLDSTSFALTSAGDGVQGALDVRFVDSSQVTLGTLVGRASLPRLTRIDQPLAPQPVTAWLEGKAADLGFLEVLTPQIDSAAGKLDLGVRLDGSLSNLHTVGNIDLTDVTARLPFLGVLLEQVRFTGRGDQAGSIDVDGSIHSGGGELTLTGSTPVQPSSARPGHIHVVASNFEAMDNAELHAVVSGTADVRMAEDSLAINADVKVPLARLVLTEIPQTAIAPSDDVMLLDSLLVLRRDRPVTAHVKITLGDSVSFSGFNFNAELGGSLTLVQGPDALPTATGTMYIEEGAYKAYGQDLRIRRGEVRFHGGPIDNPDLAVTATRTTFAGTSQVTAGLRIQGSLHDPDITLFSEPAMSETQILSYMLTGGPVGAGAGGGLLQKALSVLGLQGGGAQLAPALGQQVGLEQAKFSTARDVRGTSVAFGRFLTPKLYVSYGIGVFDPVSTLRLRYLLSNRFTLLAEAGKVTSADALIKIESSKKPGSAKP